MSDFVFATSPINSSIPVVTVVFNINNLIYDETDPLTDITARVDVVSTGQSPVIDDTGAFLYGWPRERTASNANQITVIPLPATKDDSGDGNHIRNLAGTDVHYTLTVSGTRNSLPVTLVTAQRFDVDAATADGTMFADLVTEPDSGFTQPLTAAAKTAIETYLADSVLWAAAAPTTGQHSLGEIVGNTVPVAGGWIGWVCTTPGTPGVWKGFGAIEA